MIPGDEDFWEFQAEITKNIEYIYLKASDLTVSVFLFPLSVLDSTSGEIGPQSSFKVTLPGGRLISSSFGKF